MKNVRLFHMIGSWSFVLLGMGHLATYLFLPKTPEQEKMMQVMKDFVISMPGPDSTLLLFHEGFSLMMGLLLICYGTVNILFLAADSFDFLRSKHIAMLNVLVSLLAVVLSVIYFFIVPVVFTTISLIAFGLALGLSLRASGTPQKRGAL